jgi:hypothetical protein
MFQQLLPWLSGFLAPFERYLPFLQESRPLSNASFINRKAFVIRATRSWYVERGLRATEDRSIWKEFWHWWWTKLGSTALVLDAAVSLLDFVFRLLTLCRGFFEFSKYDSAFSCTTFL